ncbi:uncharacterized protein LOC128883975 [Hylaeus volcanicus]|uniref:uncharacterized protein LOC128883975 n=1 Tax=Hylaeus volcanicus TaxID=313075 RepID=UPI0023B77857|nr:uncharacterized protein LOC128883975 [Hylaeus volcanicus]
MDSQKNLKTDSVLKTSNSSNVWKLYMKDILQWKNPSVTTAIFVAVNILFIFFHILHFSLLNILCLGCLAALMLGFAVSIIIDVGPADTKPLPFISQKTIEEYMVLAYEMINAGALKAHHVLTWRDRTQSLNVSFALALLTYISSKLSFYYIAVLSINLLLCWKHVHNFYTAFIESHYDDVKQSMYKRFHTVYSKCVI